MHIPMLDLTKRLLEILPSSFDRVFFTNSGAEAIENAVKISRSYNRRTNIVAFRGGYHGRTIGTMALTTSKTVYHVGFGPFMPGAVISPYPYCHRCDCKIQKDYMSSTTIDCCGRYEHELDDLFKTQVDPSDVSAFVLETVMGEGGYLAPPKGFLKKLRALADEKKILLIADEVQCGFGRTGKNFGFEHFDIQPDIVVMAKGLASGMPLSAVAARSELVKDQVVGSMGGTYSGNVAACAAGVATLDVFKEEKILDNVQVRSKEFFSALFEFKKNPKYHIADVRGLGLMIAIEFDDKVVPKGTAAKITSTAIANGLLLMTTGPYETIRFMPPLNISASELADGIALIKKSLDIVFA